MIDPLIENSRQVREQLLKKFGGLPGLCDKLEEMDHARQKKRTPKRRPRQVSLAAKNARSKSST